jgi:predicted helicase
MKKAKIYYACMGESWRKEKKLTELERLGQISNVSWREITPDKRYTWLNEDSESDFECHIAIGSKETKTSVQDVENVIFKLFSLGVGSNRDEWVFSFTRNDLQAKINKLINNYNLEVNRFYQKSSEATIENFINLEPSFIKWTDRLKIALQQGDIIVFENIKIRNSLYRPFVSKYLYFDHLLNQRRYQQQLIFPSSQTEKENLVICIGGYGRKEFSILASCYITDLNFYADPQQSFPFYIYDKDGKNRQENITDWALETFRSQYQDQTITKWDIFHYTYAVLHHPHYCQRYAANLKRELPRIPFAPEFWPFAIAGKRLAEIHVNYEQQPEYRLKHLENKDLPIDWRVEKMRLSKDKTQIKYNEFLTLTGIPLEVFEYRLGNRSALDWIIDQYQIKTDKRSGIVNDPNRLDDEEYIVRLIKQVITISLETVQIVKNLPDLGLPKD